MNGLDKTLKEARYAEFVQHCANLINDCMFTELDHYTGMGDLHEYKEMNPIQFEVRNVDLPGEGDALCLVYTYHHLGELYALEIDPRHLFDEWDERIEKAMEEGENPYTEHFNEFFFLWIKYKMKTQEPRRLEFHA